MSNKLRKIIIAVVIILVIGAITLLVLVSIRGVKKTISIKSTSAKAIMIAFQHQVSTKTLAKGYTVTSDKDPQSVYIKDKAINKYLVVTTTNSSLISDNKGFTTTQLTSLTASIRNFLEKQGLSPVDLPDSNVKTILLGYTYGDISCEFKQVPGADAIQQTRLLCASAANYKDQAATTEKLLAIWPNKSITPYTILSLKTASRDSMTVAALNAMTNDTSSHYLIFVENNGAWTYIGDASSGAPIIANSEYIINADIKKGLDNPTYGPLLHDFLFTDNPQGLPAIK